MLIYCRNLVNYGTRPVRDVDIMQYYGKIRQPSSQDAVIMQMYGKIRPVQSGMLIYCSIMVKYGTRPVRVVDILQYYGKIWHPSSQRC